MGDPLPYGNARLMWSFNRDAEVDPRLKDDLNSAMRIGETQKRERRQDLARHGTPVRSGGWTR